MVAMKGIRVDIRWMIRRDMPEVMGIEASGFQFPWSEEDFIRCLKQKKCIGHVAEHSQQIVGFFIYELFTTELHILNFAVDHEFWRLGVGQQMVAKMKGKLDCGRRRTRLRMEVSESNLAGQKFLQSQGFRAVKVLHGIYEPHSDEDAYLMEYRKPSEAMPGIGINASRFSEAF